MPKIQVENLTKIFGRQPQRALQLLEQGRSKQEILKETGLTVGVNQANFEVHAGEIFVIMGLSGSGKSTLVRLLNRLIEPTSGRVLIDGQDIVRMNTEQLQEVRRKKLGMVFQKFALFPHRTVLDNAAYGLEVQNVPKAEREKKAQESLALVGLAGWEKSYPDQLSGGMQQRVGLARALANEPDVLLMDEAFSALDPLIRKDMQDELLELQSSMQKTIIFITHDLDEALKIGDRIALMKDGAVVQVGSPEEILTNPANEYVERFVEDVDRSKILSAEHVMKRAETITLDRGPRVALQLMRDRGVSTLYVVDKRKMLLGVLTADAVNEAKQEGKTLEDVLRKEVPTVGPQTLLNDLFDLVAFSDVPVAVVEEQGKLLGVIVKGAVLGGLAGKVNQETGLPTDEGQVKEQ
ncbi:MULTISPECIES: glycine betaine/L-proline ABC transporter ATP-binding protein ProV [Brevibacillus]|uniref:Quaternary amine transport ATP-binding protein n=1 Tax=Brevibacillus invocatus TaxID=173959 RepID=A0A3M8C6L6_9BACL|nr:MULTISPECIES: glycine betaine/L-proline ABC transporter ATP-binding protein ProV [Brevibacillus]MCM3078661.1 glycine betaine/L-proline ABC transporter ATP-binding protein ProV [Brevibacillus invocatus]MCM3429090.1 glycine betaine/L-proline ABC transporter ATP-binding protein ProV [Brevibacillus invocatus]MDH4616230.1 glycine betaine/L-proline ABC transporter ATP-binding protein ProV [Brevibacillus sp. AY1]RNB71191.1 proline/glycine betaine ABC transporter ATP-binding protein ProV [Brevibacil